MSSSLVRRYYPSKIHQEWRRQMKDAYHQLELDTPCIFWRNTYQVLDAGCGSGRYSVELARQVTLLIFWI